MRKLSLLLVLALVLGMLSGMTTAMASGTPEDPITITYLSCWNGGGGAFPEDPDNCLVMQKIIENTGVLIKMESITTNETEKLNTMFASGVMPDLVNAPYWNTTSGEGKVIKDAGAQGMLYDVAPLLDDYPNVKKLFDVGIVARDYLQFDVDHPEFNGARYVIPQQTPGGNLEDITNWAYGVFMRGDIIDALGINPEEITTFEQLVEVGKQIRDGDFKDTTGKPVIPFGTWHNGWSWQEFTRSLQDGTYLSNYRLGEDGKTMRYEFDSFEERKIMALRTLLAEGLIDVECFSNTDTMAKEKFAIGKIAIFGAQPGVDNLRQTLYETNPEMQYRRLGPQVLNNGEGPQYGQTEKMGRSGSPVMFLSGELSEEKARAVLRVLDYLNSDEGKVLARWGVEGETFEYNADGIPVYLKDFQAAFEADPKVRWNMGVESFANGLIGADDRNSKYPTPEENKTKWDKLMDEFKAQITVTRIDKVSMNYLERAYPDLANYQDKVSTVTSDWDRNVIVPAAFAESDEAAMAILETARQQLRDAGVADLCAFIDEQIAAYPNPDELGY